MGKKLIYADDLMDTIRDDEWIDGRNFAIMHDHIKGAKAVDAVEVVHGKWMDGYPIHCSVCGGAAPTDYEDVNRYEAWLTPYCPNCGAHMDGGN